ncbi:MAG: hypothetical protein ACRCW2_01190 [Cellulosilyticaceae bacterium]
MTHSETITPARGQSSSKKQKAKVEMNIMKKGYQEMADINLSISTLCFEVESEVETYYDRIAESE